MKRATVTLRPHPFPPARALAALAFSAAALVASGCVNSKTGSVANQLALSGSTTSTSTATGNSVAVDSFRIANVAIAAASSSSSSSSAAPTTTIYIDPSRSTPASGTSAPMVSSHCSSSTASGSTSSKPCVCVFSWTETNTTSGRAVATPRTVETSVTNAQASLVTCPAPDVYTAEIPEGTTIKITVAAGAGSTELFTFQPYNYKKSGSAVEGSFRDIEGHSFENIRHYACHEQFKRGTVITSKIETKQHPQSGDTVQYPYGNKFCVQKAGGTPSADCPNIPGTLSYSAQSNYYNFYVRAYESGDVNQWNDRYQCPTVAKESLNGIPGPYPMDTTFALSLGKTADFNVGVEAFVELAKGNDPIAQNAKACDGSAISGNTSTTGFVRGCLGFAAKPNSDGTCPYLRNESGDIVSTFRLRRFVALYPPVFQTDGKAPTTPQPVDTIYVLDRPVKAPSSNDPRKPFTMRGPKPCPFSMFDAKGVTGMTDPLYASYGFIPGYVAVNNNAWTGTNVDGIEFPNADAPNSCSTSIALTKLDPWDPNTGAISLATVNRSNPVLQHLYVRPMSAWSPHYEEDTEFLACAPQPAPKVVDPPLHFARDPSTGNVSWCAESYPSQNDNVTALDLRANSKLPASSSNPYLGRVRPYTSHVAKHSASSDCHATIPDSIPRPDSNGLVYPAASAGSCGVGATTGLARHPANAVVDIINTYASPPVTPAVATPQPVCANQTCDRTATPNGGTVWTSFPLLADAAQVEQAIASDTTFGCVVTWDNGGAKAGKKTPTQGCCGVNVQVYSGTGTDREHVNTNAHLEPDAACLTPEY